jgi:hypothetical protein
VELRTNAVSALGKATYGAHGLCDAKTVVEDVVFEVRRLPKLPNFPATLRRSQVAIDGAFKIAAQMAATQLNRTIWRAAKRKSIR